MSDQGCTQFLQWALPQLGYRWAGFRKVRQQVYRRLRSRLDALGLSGAAAYIRHLASYPSEWEVLDGFCRHLVFTYFDTALHAAVGRQMVERLDGAGLLVIGQHEQLPPGCRSYTPGRVDTGLTSGHERGASFRQGRCRLSP